MRLQFTKMQALGNDFIILDDRSASLKRISGLSRKLCDRRFGIGADQLLILCCSAKAGFRMRIFNADGSEVEMCGNGIRCLGKYIWDSVLTPAEKTDGLSIETHAGIIRIFRRGRLIRVDMGEPVLDGKSIPVKINGSVLNHPVKIRDRTFRITCVSMGNPHAVIVDKNVESFPLQQYGPVIENNALFPNRTNVEFIEIMDQNNIKMRVWERGVGETMACGTGASAAGVAAALLGLTRRRVTVHLAGGKLGIHWSPKDNHVYMTGPAVRVFEGTIEI